MLKWSILQKLAEEERKEAETTPEEELKKKYSDSPEDQALLKQDLEELARQKHVDPSKPTSQNSEA